MEKEDRELLQEINKSLKEIILREKNNEILSESNQLFEKSDKRVDYSISQIQNSFDRIHDKVYNFNNLLIGAYLVLSTFPSNNPIMKTWTVAVPIFNMAFLIYIEYKQMEIHRYAAGEQDWNIEEGKQYGVKITRQTNLSLLSLFVSVCCLLYLITKIV